MHPANLSDLQFVCDCLPKRCHLELSTLPPQMYDVYLNSRQKQCPRQDVCNCPVQRLAGKGQPVGTGAPAAAWPDTLQLGRDPGSGLSRTAIAIHLQAVQIELCVFSKDRMMLADGRCIVPAAPCICSVSRRCALPNSAPGLSQMPRPLLSADARSIHTKPQRLARRDATATMQATADSYTADVPVAGEEVHFSRLHAEVFLNRSDG